LQAESDPKPADRVTSTAPTIRAINGHTPQVADSSWVATGAFLLGRVSLWEQASVWYAAILRAEQARIVIGAGSNVQDGAVIHTDPGFETRVGDLVSIGHRAVIHGSTIEDECLVGMGAVVLNGAVIGAGSLVAAGALVLEGTHVRAGSFVAGVPGSVRRPLTAEEQASIRTNAQNYIDLTAMHRI
jgi:carbonic anhydrase/acetyltransferase-like protein (isoleucine patch superfamily)